MNITKEYIKEEIITEDYIREVVGTIECTGDERIELTNFFTINRTDESSIEFFATLKYSKPRTTHTYEWRMMKNKNGGYPDYFAYTIIKNAKTGKHVDRSINTTKVTDKILYTVCSRLKKDTNLNVSPDLLEIKRFLKFLGTDHQCYNYSVEYFVDLQERLGINPQSIIDPRKDILGLVDTLNLF